MSSELNSLSRVLKDFESLKSSNESPHLRGYALEKIFDRYRQLCGFDGSPSSRNAGNQDDGHLKVDSRWYLYEARWRKEKSDNSDLQSFIGKLSTTKLPDCRGLFLSISGYESTVQDILKKSKSHTIILFTKEDLEFLFLNKIDLPTLFSWKEKHILTKENYFVSASQFEIERRSGFQSIEARVTKDGVIDYGKGLSSVVRVDTGNYKVFYNSIAQQPFPEVKPVSFHFGVHAQITSCNATAMVVQTLGSRMEPIDTEFFVKITDLSDPKNKK